VTGFAHVRKVIVPSAVTTKTQQFLRTVGRRGNEGLVLWCGSADGDVFQVTNILIPRQRGVRTSDGVCAIVDADELYRINVELYESGLRIIAQIHSHPTHAFHSDTDDEYAIANTVGALSLVVPDFAARDFALHDCAIYRLGASAAWEELPLRDAEALIEIRAA
jgi:JAB domain-containing protein similar to deubiquitination enzymes